MDRTAQPRDRNNQFWDKAKDSLMRDRPKDPAMPSRGADSVASPAKPFEAWDLSPSNTPSATDDWYHKREKRDRARGEQAAKTKKKPRPRRREYEEDDDVDYDRIEERRLLKEERKREEEELRSRFKRTRILLPELISVSNLAKALGVDSTGEFMQQLAEFGFDDIDSDSIMAGDTAALIAQEYGLDPTVQSGESVDLRPRPLPQDPALLQPRPPIVTIMGHVDHGKTTMLDWLRKSSVAAQEHGGITQHIGAFSVRLSSGKMITFLDTPGHAAFLSMRQRGADVTDIVVLVVAADDSVKPQTIEAIKHARSSKVPIIVAINKVDKEGARIEQVKADLSRNGVEIEDFGGDVQVVCVSGKTGQGMDDLEENILALAEILDVRAELDGMAEGWVLESSIKPIGRAATVLVKRGTLRPGDTVVAGNTWAKIRMLRDAAGVELAEAGPGVPAEVLGWRDAPVAGDSVIQAPDEDRAKDAVRYRLEMKERESVIADMATQERQRREQAELEAQAEHQASGGGGQQLVKDVPFIIKCDVMGSVEAVAAVVKGIGNSEVRSQILREAPGVVNESDVEYAAITGGTIINFNSPISPTIKNTAHRLGVDILDHSVIYRLGDDVKAKMSERLTPNIITKVTGEAEVQQVFPINIRGRVYKNIAGCKVQNGVVARGSMYRILRGPAGDGANVVFKGESEHSQGNVSALTKAPSGKLESLKNVKKDVSEMRKGTECGMMFQDFQDFLPGDKIQAFEEIIEKRYL
jgi:translation initiation factor IF-2